MRKFVETIVGFVFLAMVTAAFLALFGPVFAALAGLAVAILGVLFTLLCIGIVVTIIVAVINSIRK